MAYAALVSLAQTIDKLLHHHTDQYSISPPERQQIISANEHITFLTDFLENSQERANSLIEERIRDVANKVEDTIEYFMLEQIQSSVEFARHQQGLKFQYDFQTLNQELQKVTEEIVSITGEKTEIKKGATTKDVQLGDQTLNQGLQQVQEEIFPIRGEMMEVKEVMVGFDHHLMAIKVQLCGESKNLKVIPILGMRGIGKTTLAKNAYDDPLIVEHFDIRTWITISQDYRAQEILSDLLNSMGLMRAKRSRQSIEFMAELVYKNLKGWRYLIVMDDIWGAKVWDNFKRIFPDDHNGSRVILTTRFSDVAAYPNSSFPIYILNDTSIATSSSNTAFTSKDTMVGFNDDLMAIKGQLCGESQNLKVIPILGMGGNGKTTLAKNAYEDPLIVEHFDIRAWVTISQDYSAQEILSDILDSMGANRSGQSHKLMAELVHKSLKGRRYLIVMDDILSAKIWDNFKRICPDDHNGSRVILTTRFSDVAAYPNSSFPIYKLSDTSIATSSSYIAATSKDTMIGFGDDLEAIKCRLCGESQNLKVIPILGMGGIGKTTLAKNAYDDPLIVEKFDIRAWVTVSQEYSTQEILSSLLDSMKVEKSGQSNKSIEEIMRQRLKGWRYLIIMDDMWSREAWDDIKMVFPDDRNGSRIMLTTRLANVAAYPTSSFPIHEMQLMTLDQSWNLLQQKVFAREHCPLELKNTGKEIARSCRGLPLAIVVIAGLLSTVGKTQTSWENIAENVNLVINNTNDELCARILSLSYTHLPHHLRPCFLYMGGFPKDYEIRVSKLIKLWVAEGFLKPSGSKSFEEIAEEYLEDLVKRSLVLVVKMKPNGKIKSCSFHDLVRDLCISKAREEKFRLNVLDRYASKVLLESIKNERRIIIDDLDCLENIYDSTIRTIICFHPTGSSLSSLRNFRLLRVLDVVTAHFTPLNTFELPAEVFELFHLRYLAFNYLMDIPLAISNLQNLQTLIIQQEIGYLLVHLPLGFWKMLQLRHLIFIGHLPTTTPEGAATLPLENLHTLLGVRDFKCTEEILKMIPNLKTLGVFYSAEECARDSHLENLAYLHQLEKLKLEVDLSFPLQEKLQNPVFPTELKTLTLVGWGLPWKDMGIVSSLPNLQVLKLRNFACSGDEWETIEGEFRQLKFLLIDKSDLQHWITKSSHFPLLKCLVLYRCEHLSELPDDIGDIPTLELIEVDELNQSLVESAKRIQKEQQENWGNDVLQVCVGDTWRK